MRIPVKTSFLFAALLVLHIITACHGNSEEKEKSRIDTFTQNTAHKAVEQINTPIDKARAVQELVDQQAKDLKETAGPSH